MHRKLKQTLAWKKKLVERGQNQGSSVCRCIKLCTASAASSAPPQARPFLGYFKHTKSPRCVEGPRMVASTSSPVWDHSWNCGTNGRQALATLKCKAANQRIAMRVHPISILQPCNLNSKPLRSPSQTPRITNPRRGIHEFSVPKTFPFYNTAPCPSQSVSITMRNFVPTTVPNRGLKS